MGCSASTPDAVLNDMSVLQNQKAAGDVVVDVTAAKIAETVPLSSTVGDEGGKAIATKIEPSKSEKVAKVEEPPTNENVSKSATRDPVQRCDGFDGTDSIIAKKGYVVFEINLDGELDTCLDNPKKPLPKRLKRLEPLPRAPKLTAEELNEKLERAEQKHLKALAMRKSGISRRFEKFVKQPPCRKGDNLTAPAQRNDDAGESESASTGTSENDTDVGTSQGAHTGLEAPENTPKPEENDQTTESEHQLSNYDVVDLNNNNVREWGESAMHLPSSSDLLAELRRGPRTLNVLKETDDEDAE